MTLLRNLTLFFVLFLPLGFATGLAGGFLEGPMPAARLAYPILVFMVAVVPLLLPSILAVPVLHFAFRRFTRDSGRSAARWIAALATPVALLAVHLACFGETYLGIPLLALILLPGAVYGGAFGLVRRDAAKPGSPE